MSSVLEILELCHLFFSHKLGKVNEEIKDVWKTPEQNPKTSLVADSPGAKYFMF